MPLGAGLSARLLALPPRRLQPGCARPRAPGPGAVSVVARRGGGSGGGQPAWRGKAAGRAASAALADAPSARPLDSVVAASASAPPPLAPPAAAADGGATLGDFAADLLQRRLRKAAKLQKRALRQARPWEHAPPIVGSADSAPPSRPPGCGKLPGRGHRARGSRCAAATPEHAHVRAPPRGNSPKRCEPLLLRPSRRAADPPRAAPLRSDSGVEKALVLPAAGGAKQLTPALRALGASRDCEAVAACVNAAAAAAAEADGALPPAEAAVMASALRMVEARHAAGTAAAAAALRGRRVQRALAALETAVDGPLHVRKLAARPAAEGAARQLLHAVVNLLAHDAWCAALRAERRCDRHRSLSPERSLGATFRRAACSVALLSRAGSWMTWPRAMRRVTLRPRLAR